MFQTIFGLLERVLHPEIGLEADTEIGSQIDVERGKGVGNGVASAGRKFQASPTLPLGQPVMVCDAMAGPITWAPSASWVRSHGSNAVPSSRRQAQ